jgi:hypothetical protein
MSPEVLQTQLGKPSGWVLERRASGVTVAHSPLLLLRVMTSADLNQDGHGDLVVGAPGYSHPGRFQIGRVYIIYGNDLGLPPIDLDLDKEAHGILEGFQVRCPITSFLS